MNLTKYIGCLLLCAADFGANVGDTFDQVIAEKGPPKSQIEAGPVRILNYSDATIKLRDNVVVSVGVVKSVLRTAGGTAQEIGRAHV